MAARKSTPKPAPSPEQVGDILTVHTGTLDCFVVGTTPMICNRVSEKAKRELLMPKGRKTRADKALNLKHQPLDEYRALPYTLKDETQPTLLAVLATAFKGAIRNAALDLPGATKAQIGRLVWVQGERLNLYGIPKLSMMIVRSADMNKTPDVRTRAIVPRWACHLSITYVQPLVRAQAVANLLAAAGLIIGVGDGRNEKGALNYGQFKLVAPDDPEYLAIVAEGGRAAQEEALAHPVAYDDDTTELLSWFEVELERRKLEGVPAAVGAVTSKDADDDEEEAA